MKDEPTVTQEKPILDEETFQRLLEAAYVLQEQSDADSAPATSADYTHTLAEIVDIQQLIQSHHLDLQSAMNLIAERAQALTRADATAIGVVDGDQLLYRAASGGDAAAVVGSRLPFDSALSTYGLRHGRLLQSLDSANDSHLDAGVCRERSARSLIAVPLFHEGQLAGVLEIVFSRPNAFQEHDVRTGQLLAGLVTEAIARSEEREWKQTLAAERATMLEALEKIKPQLERLAVEPETPARPATPVQRKEIEKCRSCGEPFQGAEFFCVSCGTSRDGGQASSNDIQSKWATLWHLKLAADRKAKGEPEAGVPAEETDFVAEMTKSLQESGLGIDSSAEEENSAAFADPAQELPAPPASIVRVSAKPPGTPEVWSSASHAREWLESIETQQPAVRWMRRIWRSHRANLYLAAAFLLLMLVIFSRGTSVPSAVHPKSTQNLTLFERALVAFGIAETAPPPPYMGSPDVRVWVDLHTALYYCPGSDLYGKTVGGKFTTQKDAQQDQFEPALRKVCD